MWWQFRKKEKKLQQQWTPLYCPLLPHLLPELKSEERSLQTLSEFQSSPVTSSFVNELSLSEQKTRRKCLCSKHKLYYRWSFSKFPSVSSLSVKSLVEPVCMSRPLYALSAIPTITGKLDHGPKRTRLFLPQFLLSSSQFKFLYEFNQHVFRFYNT